MLRYSFPQPKNVVKGKVFASTADGRCSVQWVTLYNTSAAYVLVDTPATVFKMLRYSFSLNERSYKEISPDSDQAWYWPKHALCSGGLCIRDLARNLLPKGA